MKEKDGLGISVDVLFERISALIEASRTKVATAVNIAEVYTKYEIGRYIVEDEQEGKARAAYGQKKLERLSEKLTDKYGKGWSVESLTLARKFYSVYSNSVNTVYEIPEESISASDSKIVNAVYEIRPPGQKVG